MPMTIGEASAVNRLLDYLLEDPERQHNGRTSMVSALEAAAMLADKANKALMAGWHGDRVREKWGEQKPQVFADPDYENAQQEKRRGEISFGVSLTDDTGRDVMNDPLLPLNVKGGNRAKSRRA